MTERRARQRLLVLLGPTAVGKTALSLALARELGAEIISGDSMLVYRGFDIGTAKPTVAERQGIPHHLLDIREPDEQYAVTDFVQEAARLIEEISGRGHLPLLAGGTGLYIKALLEGYEFNATEGHEEYRQQLEELARARGKAYVHDLLAEADPEAAARLHVNDLRRVIRALEVQHFGGEQLSQQRRLPEQGLCYDALVLGLRRDRRELYQRIDRRVEQMFAEGLTEEVQGLLARGVPRSAQAMQGIGYKETAAWLAGELPYEEAVALIQKSTRHFAKRQLTWYRKMPYIRWLDADSRPEAELLQAARQEIAGFWAADAE